MAYVIYHISGRRPAMKRTTIFANDTLINEFKDLAREENRSVADMVREAMEQYVRQKRQKRKKLSFIGVGSSGRSDVAKRHEELLWRKSTK
jgi:metal-responsive CopG/Arc/MetJ family transcriptional regulator